MTLSAEMEARAIAAGGRIYDAAYWRARIEVRRESTTWEAFALGYALGTLDALIDVVSS